MLPNPNTQDPFQVALSDLGRRLAAHRREGEAPLSCFISYAWTPESKAFTKQLYEDLTRVGLTVFFDMEHNQTGTDINKFIEKIEQVDGVIVCYTPFLYQRYEKREGVVTEELDKIIEKYKRSEESGLITPIWPIMLSGSESEEKSRKIVPSPLSRIVYTDFRGIKQAENIPKSYEQALWQLLKGLYQTGQNPHLKSDFDLTWHEWESKQRLSSEPVPDVEQSLASLKQAADLKSIELELPQLMSFYVPPDSVPHVGSEARVPLEEKLRTFLRSNETVLLLLGDAGMGKTVAGLKLVDALWERGCNTQAPSTKEGASEAPFMPLRIELKHFNEATAKDCVEGTLREQGLSQSAIEQLKQSQHHRLLVIFDGLDELAGGGLPALFMENGLSQWPRAKAIIGCRNEYLVNYPHYKSLLSVHTARNSLIECQLAPLTEAQIEDYIDSRVKLEENHPDKLTLPKADYVNLLEQDASLKALIQTPFLLKLYTEARAYLEIAGEGTISRVSLYDAFMKAWFHRQAMKVIEVRGAEDLDKEKTLKGDFLRFSKSLAFSMYAEGLNEVDYGKKAQEVDESIRDYESESDDELSEKSKKRDSNNQGQRDASRFNWEQFFSDKDPKVMERRRGCPLRFVGGRYSFIHQSFLEYFIARSLFQALGKKEKRQREWGARCLMKAPKLPVVVDFLSQMVEEDKTGKAIGRLYQLIQSSKGKTKDTKKNTPYRFGSSNAMTVLNYANHAFAAYARTHPKVFEGIAAPYANLMQGELSGIDFRGSDLRHAELISAILDHTNLRETNLDGVEFRQMPAIHVDGEVRELCTPAPSAGGGMMAGVTRWSRDIQRWMSKGEGYEAMLPIKTNHEGDITSVSMSPDGAWIASGSLDFTVRLWRASDGKAGPVCRGHEDRVRSVALNGDWIVSGSWDGTVRLWRASDGTAGPVCRGHKKSVASVALNEDWIVSGSHDWTVRLWRASDGSAGPVCRGHESRVDSVALNGDWIVSGSDDCTVRLWRLSDGSAGPVCRGHEGWVNSVALNGDWIVSGSLDNTVRLWRASDGSAGPVFRGHEWPVTSVALNGDWIVSGSGDSTVRLWRASDGTPGPVCRGHEGIVKSVALNGAWIVSGSEDNTVRLWHASDGTPGPVCRGHERGVNSVALNSDWIVSGSLDCTVRLWRLSDGTPGPVCRGHDNWVESVALNGDWIVSGSEDNTVRLWHASDGTPGPVCRGHERGVNSVALNSDWIVSGSLDCTVRLWRLSDGTPGPVCRGHDNWVESVALNGDWIVSGSADKTVRLWRLSDGSAGPVCRGHENWVTRVAFSPTGDLIASLSAYGRNTIYLVHRVTDGRLMREAAEAPWVKPALEEKNNTQLLRSGIRLRAESDGKMVYLVEENPSHETAIRLWSRGRDEVRLSAKGCDFFGSKGLRGDQKELLRQTGAKGESKSCMML